MLRPGGRFITQQVGPGNDAELNEVLGAEPPASGIDVEVSVGELGEAGMVVDETAAVLVAAGFTDIGAVIFQLMKVAWQILDFDLERFDSRLRALHNLICSQGPFTVRNSRILIRAHRR